MSLEKLRKMVMSGFEEDINRLRTNMETMRTNTARMNEQLDKIIALLEEIKRCTCNDKGERK